MIQSFLEEEKTEYECTENIQEADIIVLIDTCIGTYVNFLRSINYIKKAIEEKKENAQVIVSGCLSKGVNFELDANQKEILKQVTLVKSEKIVEYTCRMLKPQLDEFWLQEFELPYKYDDHRIAFSIVEGCLNRCSFCKSNYMNFALKSVPYQTLAKFASAIDGTNINHMNISSSNLSLYGVDLYKKPLAHDAIKLLTSPDCVKFVYLGALINFYPELIKEIIENPKIKTIFISLESGSERVYNLMNRPISLKKLIDIIKQIKKYRKDIMIDTELICGFPTETLDDLKRSIELVQELDVNPQFAHPYIDSPQVPSSKLTQHSFAHNIECMKYVEENLTAIQQKFDDKILTSEMLVINKNEDKKKYRVLYVDSSIGIIHFDELPKEYNIGDIIPANTITLKQIAKRRTLKKTGKNT